MRDGELNHRVEAAQARLFADVGAVTFSAANGQRAQKINLGKKLLNRLSKTAVL